MNYADRGECCRAIQGAVCDLLDNGEVPTLADVRRVLRLRFHPSAGEYETAILGAGEVGEAWGRMTPEQRAAQYRTPTSEELQIFEWSKKMKLAAAEIVVLLAAGVAR